MDSPNEDPYTWTLEKLRRKCDQEGDLAWFAHQDNDKEDEKRHTDLACKYAAVLRELS